MRSADSWFVSSAAVLGVMVRGVTFDLSGFLVKIMSSSFELANYLKIACAGFYRFWRKIGILC